MVYFRRSRTLIFCRKLPGNWGVVARKSPRSEWVKNNYVWLYCPPNYINTESNKQESTLWFNYFIHVVNFNFHVPLLLGKVIYTSKFEKKKTKQKENLNQGQNWVILHVLVTSLLTSNFGSSVSALASFAAVFVSSRCSHSNHILFLI